jgi:hypothetical protein
MLEIEFVKSQLKNFNVVQVLASTTGKQLKFNCNTSTNKVRYLVDVKNCPLEIYSTIENAIEAYNSHV